MFKVIGLTGLFCASALFATPSISREFGGYECTDDCSGHAAGYLWAERKGVTEPDDCPAGNSQSFHEGCLVFTEDPSRGADEDDDGEPIE
jgi:hypothetical protein